MESNFFLKKKENKFIAFFSLITLSITVSSFVNVFEGHFIVFLIFSLLSIIILRLYFYGTCIEFTNGKLICYRPFFKTTLWTCDISEIKRINFQFMIDVSYRSKRMWIVKDDGKVYKAVGYGFELNDLALYLKNSNISLYYLENDRMIRYEYKKVEYKK